MIRSLWLRRLQRWMSSRPTSTVRTQPKKFRVRPRLEQLEERTLFSANTYTVNLATDNVKNTGQENGDQFHGDLRWCIEQADLNPGSIIKFDPTVFPSTKNTTIALSQGELQIAASMTISGLGSNVITVSGTDGKGGSSRVFDITNASSVVGISGLTITKGNGNVFYTSVAGNQGGDIFNSGTLTLTNDVVSDGLSEATSSGAARGGGIFNAEGSSGTTGATLNLINVIVEGNTAVGNNAPGSVTSAALGAGGGIYNDSNATVTVSGTSQFLKNQALGWNSPDAPLFGFSAADAGPGEGGGIFNKGILNLNGTSTAPLIFSDNQAIGGKGGNGAHGHTPTNSGPGSPGGNGGSAGAALGGGVYNTSPSLTLQYVNFLGNQALGGKGGDGAHGGNAKGNKGENGGSGGAGGAGGFAEGGGIYNGIGAINIPNVLFSLDSSGTGNQAIGGNGGNGGSGGNGTTGSKKGGNGGNGGDAGNAGLARGGAIANLGGSLTFTATFFNGSEANGGIGGNGGSNGAVENDLNGSKVTATSGDGGKASAAGGIGGSGGNGGAAGAGGSSQGGAVYNQSGDLSFTNDPATIAFTASQSLGGAGGVGGNGGDGLTGGSAGTGGLGGIGAGGGNGGSAQGGGFYNVTGAVSINGANFEANKAGVGNHVVSGSGGAGGHGGMGGQGGDSKGQGGPGGNGGAGGAGGVAGLAEGGAGGNQGSHTTITNSIVSASTVQSGAGGAGGAGGTGGNGGNNTNNVYYANGYGGSGGNAGDGGNSAIAFGGAIAVTTSDLTISNSSFGNGTLLGNQVTGGAGGAGGLGGTVGEFGHPANWGGYWRLNVNGSPPALVNPAPGTEVAGNGGKGGIGATVFGGAISTSQGAQAVTINSTTFVNNGITAGVGGPGGSGGLFATAGGTGHDGDRLDINGNETGLNGTGGNGGSAIGGTLSFSTTTAQNTSLNNVSITGSSATGGAGGAGAINFGLNFTTGDQLKPVAGNGWGSVGGVGGSVQGVNLANVNYNLSITSSTLSGGKGIAGSGGAGGGASVLVPFSWEGGAGGAGGSVQGGAVFFSNGLAQTTLNLFFNSNSASNNSLRAGNGGEGGNAGASGSKNVTGGAGGQGGNAQGGGLYILTGGNSVTITSLNSDNLLTDTAAGGAGGIGGAGFNSVGGNGGFAQGGALYNDSVNSTKPSSLTITAVTMAGDQATGGNGGRAGSATTPNGGAGGPGGNGGDASGGALYNSDNTSLTVINSTLGGNGGFANVVTGGLGARGGDAGTPANVASNNGGAGGNGGNVFGGNVFVSSNSATFENDTLVFGQAAAFGLGGAGGGGAGKGGQTGPAGANGTGVGGGYYAGKNSTDTIANTIIDLNIAQSSSDVAGKFVSMNGAGHNIIGNAQGSSGFSISAGDQIGMTAAQLNLGPLQNNGGPSLGAPGNTSFTLTEAPQGGSVALGTGNVSLVPAGITTDQRGPTFARIVNGKLDVGALETQVTPPPPPPGPPGSPGGAPPPGGHGLTTFTTIVSIQNSYPGLVQLETVTAEVTNANGFVVNEGVVTFQVNGQTIFAPVHNGVATATFATGLLDLSVWPDLLFTHPLTASFSDSSSIFAPSGTATSVAAIWIDFFLSLLSAQLRGLNQLQ